MHDLPIELQQIVLMKERGRFLSKVSIFVLYSMYLYADKDSHIKYFVVRKKNTLQTVYKGNRFFIQL